MDEKPKKKLTRKQRVFAKEYLVSMNATMAAKKAGYSKKTAGSIGHEVLKKPEVKEYIQKEVENIVEKLGIDEEYILGTIKDTIERCKQAKPVLDRFGKPVLVETEDGEMVPAYTFDSGSILKGAELLGKFNKLKLFTDKIEHSGEIKQEITIEKVDLEERIKLLKERKK